VGSSPAKGADCRAGLATVLATHVPLSVVENGWHISTSIVHRLVASSSVILTIGLRWRCGCVSAPLAAPLGLAALALVILQGVSRRSACGAAGALWRSCMRQRRSSFCADGCLAFSRSAGWTHGASRRRLMTADGAPPGRCHHGGCVWANRLRRVLRHTGERVERHLFAALVTLHVILLL